MPDPAIPNVLAAIKGAQWEKAKGELRALVAIQGSYTTTSNRRPDETGCFERLDLLVRQFIENVENDGLHD